jgi:glutamyl-tRNA synthetase
MNKIRTRFAPSPTGFLHIGGVRTALYAWLLAKQNKGDFVIRIEDTDKDREVEGSIEHILKTFKMLGLDYDEGPDKPGPFGPYMQSERLPIYHEWALKLVSKGLAYGDPFSKEEVEGYRIDAKQKKLPFLYRNYRPNKLPAWDKSKPLRFKSNPQKYTWNDIVLGQIQSNENAIDDFILIKSDGYPTYNFAHIVDDYLMQISHVIRSQEFIASVPKFLNLYQALEIEPPILATVPAILGPDGRKKLSKRDNAKDILDYLKEGYLKEALINFMALLGWNDSTEQEIFNVDQLISKFKLSNVQKSPAKFDERRLVWMNGQYIRMTSTTELYALAKSYWPNDSKTFSQDYKMAVLDLIKERLKYLSEIPDLTSFFFVEPKIDPSLITDNKILSKIDNQFLIKLLELSHQRLSKTSFKLEEIKNTLNDLLLETAQKPVVLFSLIRIATTQSPASPSLFETIAILGKDKTLSRIETQIKALKNYE